MNLFIISLLTVIASHAAMSGTASRWEHTRPVTSRAADLLGEAAERSPLVRSLLDTLERTDVFVYVTHALAISAAEPQAYVRFVSDAGGRRYLLIQVNCWHAAKAARIAALGHELHHALEIAREPDVRDNAGLERLYRRIGYECGRRKFETFAARRTTQRIREQLGGSRE